jgi:hypothetical protein
MPQGREPLDLLLSEARKNEELIALADSQMLASQLFGGGYSYVTGLFFYVDRA